MSGNLLIRLMVGAVFLSVACFAHTSNAQGVRLETIMQPELKSYTERWFKAPHRTQVKDDVWWEDWKLKSTVLPDVVLRQKHDSPVRGNLYEVIQVDNSGNFTARLSDVQLRKVLRENDIDLGKSVSGILSRKAKAYAYEFQHLRELDEKQSDYVSFNGLGVYRKSLNNLRRFAQVYDQSIFLTKNLQIAKSLAEEFNINWPGLYPEIVKVKIEKREYDAVVVTVDQVPVVTEFFTDKDQRTNIDLRNSIQDYAKKAKNQLSKAAANITQKSKNEKYGGDPGKEYFKARYELVVKPALLDTLRQISAKARSEQSFPLFLSLLYELGRERHNIASMVWSEDNEFGQMLKFGHLVDPVNDVLLPSWYKFLQSKLKAGAHGEELLASLQRTFRGSRVELLTGSQADDTLRWYTTQWKLFSHQRKYVVYAKENPQDFGEMHFFFDPLLSFRVPPERLKDMQAFMIHRPASITNYNKTSSYFYRALNAKSSAKRDLIDALGRLLLRISHQTEFARGQAAISEWVLQGIAEIHGYRLKYSDLWQTPNPSPDMHALSIFEEAQFLEEFRKNATLE